MLNVYHWLGFLLFLNSAVLITAYGSCCPNITIQENFEQNKYQGLWYDFEHTSNVEYVCGKHNYSLISEDLLQLNSILQNENGTISEETGSFLVQVSPHPVGHKLVTSTQWLDLDGFYILRTDYETYSIEYSCTCTEDGQETETVYILWRSPFPQELQREAVQEILRENEVNAVLVSNYHGCILNA